MKPAEHGTAGYRRDIDGLRAIAVLAVIAFHASPGLLGSGYLGVDIFFVISGYVITGYLVRAPKRGLTSYILDFYSRRIRRLLPALLLCILVTAWAFVLVTTRPPKDVFDTGAWALLGLSNIQLFLASRDYFALEAGLNPFTHTWSLGVEEQFYLIYPALFAILGWTWHSGRPAPRNFALTLGVLSVISFVAWLIFSGRQPEAAFYLMPTRFWELGLGALVYWFASRRHFTPGPLVELAVAGALIASLAAPAGLNAITTPGAVLLTGMLLAGSRPGSLVGNALSAAPLVGVGRLSYSLYLWHWPALIIGKWTIGTSALAVCLCLLVGFVLACLSYWLVERPIRTLRHSVLSALAVVCLLGALWPAFYFTSTIAPAHAQSANNFLPAMFNVPPPPAWPVDDCQGRDKVALLAEPFEHCLLPARSAYKPNALFLIGDSHAAQLLPMVQAATEGLPFQVRFINPENYEDFPVGFFHQSSASPLLDFIIEHARPGDVLTIAFHRGHLNAERDRHIPVSEPFAINDVSQTFIQRTKPFLERFAGKGGRVVLIADTPLMGAVATSSACALQIRLFGSSVCRIERQQDEWTRGQQDAVFMALVADDPDRIRVWDPLPAIYGDEDWLDVLDDRGTYLMWDWNHISEPLARKLSEPFQALLENELASAN